LISFKNFFNQIAFRVIWPSYTIQTSPGREGLHVEEDGDEEVGVFRSQELWKLTCICRGCYAHLEAGGRRRTETVCMGSFLINSKTVQLDTGWKNGTICFIFHFQ